MPVPNYNFAGLSIYKRNNYVIIETGCGVKIGFDGEGLQSVVTVMVPGSYADQMYGLCGDCDGQLDDLKTSQGVDVSDRPNKYQLISDSYVVDDVNDFINE